MGGASRRGGDVLVVTERFRGRLWSAVPHLVVGHSGHRPGDLLSRWSGGRLREEPFGGPGSGAAVR